MKRPKALIHYDYITIADFETQQMEIGKGVKLKVALVDKVELVEKSLYIFSKTNFLRRFTDTVTNHWIFDNIIIVLIVVSTLTLAFENPLEDPES